MTTLGFVVLAKRPNPYAQHPCDYVVVSEVHETAADAQLSLDQGELKEQMAAEVLRYAIDRDSKLPHRHHRECIHNLAPTDQIAARGKTVQWWQEIGAAWPDWITPDDWEREPPVDPVEYVVGAITLADLAKPEWRVK